jgi:hypothetical protein
MKIQKIEKSKLADINLDEVQFGKTMTDHMVIAHCTSSRFMSASFDFSIFWIFMGVIVTKFNNTCCIKTGRRGWNSSSLV